MCGLQSRWTSPLRTSPLWTLWTSSRRCLSFLLLLCRVFQPGAPCDAPQLDGVSSNPQILCRSCGHELASVADVRFVPSTLALSTRNDTLLGGWRVAVQLLENPQGHRFEVLTFRKADIAPHWPAEEHFSWFQGFSWIVATCPRCHVHLGWAFQPSNWPQIIPKSKFEESEETFVALITRRLLTEDFASRLLMTPKSFRS